MRSRYPLDPSDQIAQHLFRNNPKHNTGPGASLYAKNIDFAAKEIRHRIYEIEQQKEAEKIAEQKRLQRIKEEDAYLLKAQTGQRRSYFKVVLTYLFNRWCKSLWRGKDYYLYKNEIVSYC